MPIDILNIRDIRRYKQRYEAILDYYFEHYSYFQNVRSKRFSAIKEALLGASDEFEFKSWHRIFDLQFIDNPLSSRGSLLNDPGGRFNIGDLDPIKFTQFPALYIAENYETAYRERNQIAPAKKHDSGLSSNELSLTNTASTVDLLLEGSIKSVIDLTNKSCLKQFYGIIQDIKLPKYLEKKSNKLNIPVMYQVSSYDELTKSILQDNWRCIPITYDIPSNSQIFGYLAHQSGLESILYPSKMSDSMRCLAVFPKNFTNSSSYIKIQDKNKPQNIKYHELNSTTCSFLY